MTALFESYLADALRLLPMAAAVVVAFMVLRTWVKTRSTGSTLIAVGVGALVLAFVSDVGGFSSMIWAEIQSRSAS